MKSSSWTEVKLGEILNLRRGHDLTRDDMVLGSFPVLGSNGVIGLHTEHKGPKPLIAVGRSGTVGQVQIIDNFCWPHNTTLYVDDFKGNNPYFLYFLLKNLSLKNYRGGSAVPTLNRNHLHPLKITFNNDLKSQEIIVKILKSFDDTIEINNKINKNLEELAQTLYKHWFVDFEFPNEEGKPYKSSGGEMVDSELTLIPAGWKISTISNISKSVLGGTPSRKKPNYWGGSINWIKSGELNNLRIIKPTETITEDGLNSSATKIMPIGTVLIGITGYVGAVSMLEIECSANQSVVGLLPSEGYPRSYLYGLIKNVITQIALKQTGSAQQHINKNDIDSHKIVLPNSLLIKELSNILEPIHQMISSNLSQNQRLVELRDTLLPKLMSGKIEV
jgi:type I restriction enzyme, S subunit